MRIKEAILNNSFFRYMWYGIKNRKKKSFLEEHWNNENNFEIKSFGSGNYGKAIYNIEINKPNSGFFALLRFVLDALYVSEVCGFIPFVSLINTKYNQLPSDNMFEYYYIQTSSLTNEDVQNASCVIQYNMGIS